MARTLTIGRGELDIVDWLNFINETMKVLTTHSGVKMYFNGDGLGWSEEWGEEDAYTWVYDVADWAVESDIMDEIRGIREDYQQEAVAYTAGNTQMV